MTVQVALILLGMALLWATLDKVQNPGYRCPACGTSRSSEHSEDCSWSKHYGDEL